MSKIKRYELNPFDGECGMEEAVDGDFVKFEDHETILVEHTQNALREAAMPEEIGDLLVPNIGSGFYNPEIVNRRLAEAFRRGEKKVNAELLRCATLALKSSMENWCFNWDDLKRAIEATDKMLEARKA